MGHKQKQRQRQRQQQEQPYSSEEHALLREMFAEMDADFREEQMNEQQTVVSRDNEPGPGPSHARGRDRALSDNNSDSDKHDSKRQELEADTAEEMTTQATDNLTQTTSNISDIPPPPPTATAARTAADQADMSSSVEDPIIIADLLPENFLSGNRKRVWRKLDSILHQIKALMAHVACQPAEVDTAPPPSASMQPAMQPVTAPQPEPDLQQQPHLASMQPEPVPQPALASQQPQPATMQPEPAPQPSTDPAFSSAPPPPRHSVHPPKPRVSPRGSPSYAAAAAAAGAAAGAAAATAAAAAASAHRYRFPRSASGSPRSRASAAADPSSFSTTLHLRSNFVFKAPPGALPGTADSLKERLKSFLQARLPGADIPIVDAVLFGQQATSTRVFFTLDSLAAANDLVGRRCALRGSGASIQDYLSPEEQRLKSSLWPRFLEAKARGQRPQFQRARLIVSS